MAKNPIPEPHRSTFILHSRGSDGGAFVLDESSSTAQELTAFQTFRLKFDLQCKFAYFATYLKPPSRYNHRKAPYSRTQQSDQDRYGNRSGRPVGSTGRSGRPVGWVTGRDKILRPAGQAG